MKHPPPATPPPVSRPKGLECPSCGCRHFETLRTEKQDGRVVRRRECRNCGWRCTTAEEIIGGGKKPLPVAVPEIDDPDFT